MICYWSEHYVTTKFMICYWWKRCMLWPSLWFVTGQNTVCYDQVYDLLLVRTYVMLRHINWLLCCMICCYWSERCMLRPTLWFVTGQNICYIVTYKLTAVFRILYIRPSLWFVTGQNAVCYDQVYDLLLVRTLYVTTKFMICFWSEHCMLRPSLWFVTFQNAICYDK